MQLTGLLNSVRMAQSVRIDPLKVVVRGHTPLPFEDVGIINKSRRFLGGFCLCPIQRDLGYSWKLISMTGGNDRNEEQDRE